MDKMKDVPSGGKRYWKGKHYYRPESRVEDKKFRERATSPKSG